MYKFNTLLIGQNVHHYGTLDSTNNEAKRLLKNGSVQEGTIVRADFQTHGRGQLGNTWHSNQNANLTFSIIVYPHFLKPTDQFFLTQIVSTAVVTVLKKIVPSATPFIKWPNDILLNQQKVAGILIENNLVNNRIQSTIIGIGLNVNQVEFGLQHGNPTSLRLINGQKLMLDSILELLCQSIEQQYIKSKTGSLNWLKRQYLNHLFRLEELAKFQKINGEVFWGKIKDVNPQGLLLVDIDDNREAFANKQIRFI